MRELQTIGDWGGVYSAPVTRRMWAHPVMSRSRRRHDFVRGMGQAATPVTQTVTPELSAAGQTLLTRLDSGVPYEGSFDATVEHFQAAYMAAGFSLTSGADGKYGPYTAQALSFVTGANVPAPNTQAPASPVLPAPPAPPTPSSPQNVPVTRAATGSSRLVWVAILAAIGYAGYEAMKKHRARKKNPCHRMMKKRARALVIF